MRWLESLRTPLLMTIVLGLGLVACSSEESATRVEAPLDLTAEEMEAEVTRMIATPDILDRHRHAIRLLDSLNEENLPGAIAGYEGSLNRVDRHEIRLFANAWAQMDPKGALDHMIENWPYPKIRSQAVLEVIYEWALNGDGDAARAYVDPSFDGPIEARQPPSKILVLAVLEALGTAKDWDQLTDMLSSLDDDGDRELWITKVMIAINRANGLEASKEWLDSIPWEAPNDLKVSALKRALHWVSSMPGDRAQRWYEEIEHHPRSIEVLPMAVKGWGMREPAEALPWLVEREESGVRDALMREIMIGWLQRQPGEGETWIRARLPDDQIRRAGIVPLVNALIDQRRFDDAADLAREWGLEGSKDKLLAQIFREWSVFAPDEVDAYADEKEVSSEVLGMYREMIARRGNQRATRRRTESENAEEGG